jgi:tetratricopeptide (TPR) repeat protein
MHPPSNERRNQFSNTNQQPQNSHAEPHTEEVMNPYIAAFLCLTVLSCRPQEKAVTPRKAATPGAQSPSPLGLVLAPNSGTGRIDKEIIRLQDEVRTGRNHEMSLERLGWAFVAKARESFDPGYYKLAEQCALALDSSLSNHLDAMLLRGHALHNLHRFSEAEPLARKLIGERGLPFDFGLLSDVLMEQGKLDEAIVACQKMVDLRPDFHSYARGAHLRWLRGKVAGAAELMRMAADAVSPLDPESAAWVNTRLAGYEFQLGSLKDAERSCALALEFQKDYPPALLLSGRLMLAEKRNAEAIGVLRRATELNPMPEYQWTLAEALRADGQVGEAVRVETQLREKGTMNDPRTYALFLATRAESATTALRLAEAELKSRADVFTHDALAWALAASGKLPEARNQTTLALSEGTQDARLYFHAAMIAHMAGDDREAQQFAARAGRLQFCLLPSESGQLQSLTFPPAQAVVAAGDSDQIKPSTK